MKTHKVWKITVTDSSEKIRETYRIPFAATRSKAKAERAATGQFLLDHPEIIENRKTFGVRAN